MIRPLTLGALFVTLLAGAAVLLLHEEDRSPDGGDRLFPAAASSDAGPAAPETAPSTTEEDPSGGESLTSSAFSRDITPDPGVIQGRVLDPQERPLAGARVHVRLAAQDEEAGYALVARHREEMRTDADGRFRFKVPGGGRYDLVAGSEGFVPVAARRVLPGSDVELVLEPPLRLAGRVVDAVHGEGLAEVRVIARIGPGLSPVEVTTGPGGDFVLEALPAREIRLAVLAPRHVSRPRMEVDPRDHSEAPFVIRLDPGKRVVGTVLAARDERPLLDAVVSAADKEVRVERGRFVLGGLPSEEVSVRVRAMGYLTATREVELGGSREEARADFRLKEGEALEGRILDPNGFPVEGARIDVFHCWGGRRPGSAAFNHLYRDWSSRHVEAESDASGRFRLLGLNASRRSFAIRARHPDWPETFSEALRIREGHSPPFVDLSFFEGGVVTGLVKDASGQPLEGVRVTLHRENRHDGGRSDDPVVGSDEEGRFCFEGAAEGRYRVRAVAQGFPRTRSDRFELRRNRPVDPIVLEMHPGTPVAGLVTDVEGRPIAGARISLRASRGSGSATSDAEGRFEIESLPEGPWRASVRREGYASFRRRRLRADEDGLVRIELRPQAAITGTVRAAEDGSPLSDFRVSLTRPHPERPERTDRGPSTRVRASEDGSFRLQVDDGTWDLHVRAEGRVTRTIEGITVSAEGAPPEPVEVSLVGGGSIEGYLRDEQGRAIASAVIYHRRGPPHEESYTREGRTQSDGYFLLEGLGQGWHDLAFLRGGYPLLIESGLSVQGAQPLWIEPELRRETRWVLTMRPPEKDAQENAGRGGGFVVPRNGSRVPVSPLNSWHRGGRERLAIRIESLDRHPLRMRRTGRDPVRGTLYEPRSLWRTTERLRKERSETWTHLPPGRYRATFTWQGLPPQTKVFTLAYGGEGRARIDLEALRQAERGESPAAAGTR